MLGASAGNSLGASNSSIGGEVTTSILARWFGGPQIRDRC
jgi:hypothetical protein